MKEFTMFDEASKQLLLTNGECATYLNVRRDITDIKMKLVPEDKRDEIIYEEMKLVGLVN